jgi:hypothetical protein
VLDQHFCGPLHDLEGVSGTLGDVEQAVVAVRKVQYPWRTESTKARESARAVGWTSCHYVYVKDVARANRLLLEAELGSHPDPVFNVSTCVPTSTNRIFGLLRDALGVPIAPIAGP